MTLLSRLQRSGVQIIEGTSIDPAYVEMCKSRILADYIRTMDSRDTSFAVLCFISTFYIVLFMTFFGGLHLTLGTACLAMVLTLLAAFSIKWYHGGVIRQAREGKEPMEIFYIEGKCTQLPFCIPVDDFVQEQNVFSADIFETVISKKIVEEPHQRYLIVHYLGYAFCLRDTGDVPITIPEASKIPVILLQRELLEEMNHFLGAVFTAQTAMNDSLSKLKQVACDLNERYSKIAGMCEEEDLMIELQESHAVLEKVCSSDSEVKLIDTED